MGRVALVAQVNWAGVAAAAITAPLLLGIGLVVLRDWKGLGRRYFRMACRAPFGGFYERSGFRTFRFFAGWAPFAVGLALLLIALGALLTLA